MTPLHLPYLHEVELVLPELSTPSLAKLVHLDHLSARLPPEFSVLLRRAFLSVDRGEHMQIAVVGEERVDTAGGGDGVDRLLHENEL